VDAIRDGFELPESSGWEVARACAGVKAGNVVDVVDIGDVLAEENSSKART
jgi:hypothetical protein